MSGPAPWLYLDADGFFASCEEAADPRLHGRPVGVVAGSAYADAPLIAVNTVAKRAAGVRSGDRVGVCALHRCAEGGQRPGCVRLEVVTVGGAVRGGVGWGGVGRLDAFGYERDLLRAVSALWDEATASGPDDPPGRVGVLLEALRDRSAPSLFEADPRERSWQWMLDRVRGRYGARALLWGVCGDPRGPYTGAKIAYQSFPDMVRLRWLGLAGADGVPADSVRALGLRSVSPGRL